MKQPTDDVLEMMICAAELRAGGASWEAVGRELRRHADTCRRWAREYPEVWRRLYRAAELRLAREAAAEARVTLRQLLRSEEEKTRLAAARDLLRARPVRHGRKPAETADSEVTTFISQLQGLSDDEIEDMLRDFLAAEGALARTPGSPGAPATE
ncbi:MAG TPA: hypothetical protein VKS79_05605 [Gemmataceae bacterium]|nr:hypothetical protein [Gemmataceae bacterium]